MKQIDIIHGYGALKRLSSESLPFSDAYAVFTLWKKLEPQYTFEVEQEKKLMDEMKVSLAEDGDFRFDTIQQAKDFNEKLVELHNMDVTLDVTPITINRNTLHRVHIRPEDFGFLAPFIKFE